MCRRLLCYGDSNTYGYDPRSYLGGRYPKSVRWTALLDAEGWEVINQGENGRSIPQLDQEIKTAVQTILSAKTEAAVIMLGSNDLLQCPGLTAENCGGRMERFLTSLLAETPATLKIALVAPPPMELGAWVSDQRTIETSHQLAECYEAVAHRLGIAFADAGAWGVELSYDGVHFSEKGHLAFAQGMQATLDTLR
ncbi:MAG: lipase [Clostridiales bacterium]|nr:lipase [Clostridiales bacterium]